MTHPLKIALTKRALETQLMRAGTPRKEAEQITARLPHRLQWSRLPEAVRSEISWKVGLREADDAAA